MRAEENHDEPSPRSSPRFEGGAIAALIGGVACLGVPLVAAGGLSALLGAFAPRALGAEGTPPSAEPSCEAGTRASGTTTGPMEPNAREPAKMTLEQVAQRVRAADGRTFIFDANPREMFEKRHIPGAHWVPYDGHGIGTPGRP